MIFQVKIRRICRKLNTKKLRFAFFSYRQLIRISMSFIFLRINVEQKRVQTM